MRSLILLASAASLVALSARAQTHEHHTGHPAPAPAAADPHAGHRGHPTAAPEQSDRTGVDLPVGSAPPPPAPRDHAADRVWSSGMARSRRILAQEHGGMRTLYGAVEVLEVRPTSGADAYAWEGGLSYGGDVDRLTLLSRGEGQVQGQLDHAEGQLLWSHALGPYFDLRAGLRQDVEPRARTHATFGFAGLAPYWIELEGAVFVSHKGDVSVRLEGFTDLRLTQRLILEPRAEINAAASDDAPSGLGSGLRDAELGLRLRYEIRREFAPYVGVHYARKFDETADLARGDGEDAAEATLVLGLRTMF